MSRSLPKLAHRVNCCVIDHRARHRARKSPMTAARYRAMGRVRERLRYRPGYTPPGARPTGAVRTALPVIYQLR